MPANLSLELIEELRDELPDLTYQWEPHWSESDYICAFCRQRARANGDIIDHDAKCLGQRLMSALADNV